MPIAGITKSGLAAIALAVALLWGCVIGEREYRQHASAEQIRTLHDLWLMRNRMRQEPASTPVPARVRPSHAVAV